MYWCRLIITAVATVVFLWLVAVTASETIVFRRLATTSVRIIGTFGLRQPTMLVRVAVVSTLVIAERIAFLIVATRPISAILVERSHGDVVVERIDGCLVSKVC